MERSESEEELSEGEFQPKTKLKSRKMKTTRISPDPADKCLLNEAKFQSKSNIKSSIDKKPSAQTVPETSLVKCQFCGKIFATTHNLHRHHLCCKQNPHKSSDIRKFVCEICGKSFTRSDHLNAHKKKTCSLASSATHVARSKCMHPDCEESFYHKSSLLAHLKNVHNDEIKDPVSLQFSSEKDFIEWKDKEEEKTYSYFSQQGGKDKQHGTTYFYCQHDGSSKLHLKDGMNRKTQRKLHCGPIKTGYLCLAMMKVYQKSMNELSVVYYPTHTHPLDPTDFQRQPLSKATYDLIDQQLAWDVSPLKIKKNLENGTFERSNRGKEDIFKKNDYVSIKLIRERKRRKRNARRLHKEDSESVRLLYESLKNEEHNPVLIYKPYMRKVFEGPPEAQAIPPDELFMFGFQSKQQEDLLKKGCSKVLLLDETHGTNQYKHQLLTAMVPDENNRCWPVAHLITSCSEAKYVQFFFLSIKMRCPGIDINCVMTDDASNLINSVDLAWGKNHRHLLCLWHIDQIFQKNIHLQGVPRSLDSEIYNDLKVLITCFDTKTFSSLCKAFEIKYFELAPVFAQYFKTKYLTRTEKWAVCYRNFYHANIETTGAVESFHNRLKKKYMKRRPVKRLDDLINLLLLIEEDDFATRKRERLFGIAGRCYDATVMRHHRAMEISDEAIEECLPGIAYNFKSSNDQSAEVKYHIAKNLDKCFRKKCQDSCREKECQGLCAHLFTCSCPDKSPLCKHIHKLYSLRLKNGLIIDDAIEENNNENETVQFFSGPDVEEPSKSERYIEDKLKTFDENLEKLKHFRESGQLPGSIIASANVVLGDLLKKIEATVKPAEENTRIPAMKPVVDFVSNQKLQTQRSQLPPFKLPPKNKKRKKPNFNTKMSPKTKDQVKKNLLSVLNETDGEEDADDPGSNIHPDTHSQVLRTAPDTHSQALRAAPDTLSQALRTAGSSFALPHDSPRKDCLNLDQISHQVTEPEPSFSNSNLQFTLPTQYAKKLTHTVLKFPLIHEEVSILDLKSLELHLTRNEITTCQSAHPTFKLGWLRSSILNAFFSVLTEVYPDTFVADTYMGQAILLGRSVKSGLAKSSSKNIILVPALVNGNHWVIAAFLIKQSKILFYDPQCSPVKGDCDKFLSNASKAIKEIHPQVLKWNIVVMKHDKQTDGSNCGVHICLFGQQVLSNREEFLPLEDALEYRHFIYQALVGECMKRKHYEDSSCGVCRLDTSESESIACCKCDQWYHVSCTNVPAVAGSFTCS